MPHSVVARLAAFAFLLLFLWGRFSFAAAALDASAMSSPRCQRSTLASAFALTAEEGAPGRCGPKTRVGKRKTRYKAAVRRASPRMVAALRKRDVTVEVTRVMDGPVIDAEG